MDNELLNYIQEINRIQDEMNLYLAFEYQDLLDNTVSVRQVIVLEMISKAGAITTSEIATKLEITSSAVSQLVNRLEKNGYVKRAINLENRREILIELDHLGIAYFEKLDQMEQMISEKYYAKLGMKDIKELHRIIKKLKYIVTQND